MPTLTFTCNFSTICSKGIHFPNEFLFGSPPRLDVLRKRESSTTSTGDQTDFSYSTKRLKDDLVNIVWVRKKTHELYDLQCHVAVFSICRHHHHGELMIIGAIKILIWPTAALQKWILIYTFHYYSLTQSTTRLLAIRNKKECKKRGT